MAPKTQPSLKDLLKVRIPFKSPPPGKDSVMGYNKKYGESIEKQTDRLYSLWLEMAVQNFTTTPQRSRRTPTTEIAVEQLEVLERISHDDSSDIMIWELGGKQEYQDFNAPGGNYWKYHGGGEYPYTIFRIAKFFIHPRYEDNHYWDGPVLQLIAPPIDVRKMMPFKDIVLARHNLILREIADHGHPYLKELEVVLDSKGFVLHHIPSGRTLKMYDNDSEGHRRYPLATSAYIGLGEELWESYLQDYFGISIMDVEESVGKIGSIDKAELAVQSRIDQIEHEIYTYLNEHPDIPRDLAVVSDLIGKRKEYGNLLRRRDSLIRENPSGHVDRTEYERLLKVMPKMRSGKNKTLAAASKKAYPKLLEEALKYLYSGQLEMLYDEDQDRIISNERLGFFERVYGVPTQGEMIWTIGGDEKYSYPSPYLIRRYRGAGAFKSPIDKNTGKMVFPYLTFEVVSATRSRQNEQAIISIHFSAPPEIINVKGEKGIRPFKSLFVDRFNLVLQYGYVNGYNPNFKDLVFIDSEHGPILKHIPSGKTIPTFELDNAGTLMIQDVFVPVASKYYEEWLYNTMGLEPTDEVETVAEIAIDDTDLLDLEGKIEVIEEEMLAYADAHPGVPKDYATLSQRIGKRKEYGQLVRRRDSRIRENPKKWTAEEFFTERELVIEKRYDYSYYVEPEQYEPTDEELDDPEYDQEIANEKMYDEQDLKAKAQMMEAQKAVAEAVTDDEKRIAASDKKQAVRALENAEQSRYGYWEPDPRSSKTEETQFVFDYYDDGDLAENAVESAAYYLQKECAEPYDSKTFREGMNYGTYTDSDGDWQEEISFELNGDWTPEEEEHIWHLVLGHKDHVLVYPEGRFGDVETVDVAASPDIDPEELEIQHRLDEIEQEMAQYHHEHPDVPFDYAVLSDMIGKRKEYGNLLRRRDSLIRENPRRNPEETDDGVRRVVETRWDGTIIWENDKIGGELVDIDYTDEDSTTHEYVDDDENDDPAWMQAARYIFDQGGGYDHWDDDLNWYRTETFDNYTGPPEESYYEFSLQNWTRRELEKINDYIMMEKGSRNIPKYPDPSDEGLEHISDIDPGDDEFVKAQMAVDAFEQELTQYQHEHPEAYRNHTDLAIALGRGREYGELLRNRDRLLEENPSEGMFWRTEPVSRQPDLPSLDAEFMCGNHKALRTELTRSEVAIMSIMFQHVHTGLVSLDRPNAHYERINVHDWSGEVISRWTLALKPQVGGNSGNTVIASVGSILPDGRKCDRLMLSVYGLPDIQDGDSKQRGLVFLDRLQRIFYYGYYQEGHPIFGLIRPGLTTDVHGKYHLVLFHKLSGAKIDLGYVGDTSEFDEDTDQCVVRIPLSKTVREAETDADALFGRLVKPFEEEAGEITAIDKEEQSIQARIDAIESEMADYVQLHPYEQNDPSTVVNKIGKRVEYSWLLRRRMQFEDD